MPNFLRVLLFGMMVALLMSGSKADAQQGGIWGEATPMSLFDEKPFHEVKIPDWLWDVHSYAYIAESEEAAKVGVQMTELGFVGPSFALYPSKLLPMEPGMPPTQQKEKVARIDKAGLRIIATAPPCLNGTMFAAHPDWRSVDAPGGPIPEVDLQTHPEGGWMCQMGPWGDYLIEILAEILTQFPEVDGFGFDGIHHRQACYCEHCVEAWRKATGIEPPAPDMKNPDFRRYQLFMDRRMEQFVEHMQARIKGINPDAAIVTWTTNAGRFGHFKEIPRSMSSRMNLLFDAPAQEYWLDETNRGMTVVPAFSSAYIWAIANHRVAYSEPYLMTHGNPYGPDSFPPHEQLCRVMQIITHGSFASLAPGWNQSLRAPTLDAFREMGARAKWLTRKKPEPWAALLMSDQTRIFYGQSPEEVEKRYLSNVLGAYRVLLEEHLPVTVLTDWQITPEKLAPYKVLVLPNSACLSQEQLTVIETYVRNGGGLVASLDASRFDELGNPRKDFGLAELFGVTFQGVPIEGGGTPGEIDSAFAKGIDANYWNKRKNIFDFVRIKNPVLGNPKLDLYLADTPVTFKGQAVLVEAKTTDAEPLGTITPRQEGERKTFPGILARKYGEGRVVYLAAGLDSAYYLYPYPYQRLILEEAYQWAAGSVPPVEVHAPMCVQSAVYRKEDTGSKQIIVHLFNGIISNSNHALPDEDVPLREEMVPIREIKTAFHGYDISRVHLEPGGTDLPTEVSGTNVTVTVPELTLHAMVVAEIK